MQITVTGIESAVGSVWVLTGIEYGTDRQVRFGVDHRPAADIAAGLEEGEDIDVEVEPWQVFGVFGPVGVPVGDRD